MPDRIARQRTKGWRKPEGAVIVTRPSIWGNPWKSGNPGLLNDRGVWRQTAQPIDQQTAVSIYRQWLHDGSTDPQYLPIIYQWPGAMIRAMTDALHGRRSLILSEIHTLRGRDLCCFCPPGTPCHADVLMEIANG